MFKTRNTFGQIITLPHIRFFADQVEGGGEGGTGGDGGNAFTPPASQEELDRIISTRVARAERNAREDERRKLSAAQGNDSKSDNDGKAGETPAGVSGDDVDKRIQDALADERRALAMERISDRLDKALENRTVPASKLLTLDRAQFVKDDGKTVDDAAIADWVEKNSTEREAPSRRLRAQGQRGDSATGGSVSAGRDRYDEIHNKKSGKD